MRYFFIAGERSGDLHASKLIEELAFHDPAAEILAWGGEEMQKAGAFLLMHYRQLAYMGFWEVVMHLGGLLRKLHLCKREILRYQPDVVVLVDFAGFNLRIARFAHDRGIKVAYYISPKVWAWKKNRVRSIRNYVDRMMVILPFELAFYDRLGVSVEYVGNPVAEQITHYMPDATFMKGLRKGRKIIAVLPGSREQEVMASMKLIRQVAQVFDQYEFLIAAVDNLDPSLYEPLRERANISIHWGHTYELLQASEVAIITSGTATLEAAMLNVPQLVVYKTSVLTYGLAKLFVKLQYISLVNLIAGRPVVKELIQGNYNAANVTAELERLLNDEEYKKRISRGYLEIRHILGDEKTSERAAAIIHDLGRS